MIDNIDNQYHANSHDDGFGAGILQEIDRWSHDNLNSEYEYSQGNEAYQQGIEELRAMTTDRLFYGGRRGDYPMPKALKGCSIREIGHDSSF